MTYLICGVGQAGGKIVDEMFAHKNFRKLARPLAINSTLKDLETLRHIKPADWAGISEDKGLVPGTLRGFERHVVGGFGKDPAMAAKIMSENKAEVVRFFEDLAWEDSERAGEHKSGGWEEVPDWVEPGVPAHDHRESIPFAMVVLAAGGGTGSGSTPYIVQAIRKASSVNTTVIAAVVLPATHGESGFGKGAHRQAYNAMVSLREVEKHVDGIILLDNERIAHHDNLEVLFPHFNHYAARALVDLLSAHFLEGVNMRKVGDAALPVIDIQDIRTAISFGSGPDGKKPGYASIGWSCEMGKNLGGYLLPGVGHQEVDMDALVEDALQKHSLAGIDPHQAQKSLGLLRIPASYANSAHKFPDTGALERKLGTMAKAKETHFGVTVGKRPIVSFNSILTYRRDQIERLKELERLAREFQAGGA